MPIDAGYEASSLTEVADLLDSLSPATAEQVYLGTRDLDARAVAAVAAARADAGVGGGSDDQTAAEVSFAPAGTIVATDVQAALEELDNDIQGIEVPALSWTNVAGGIGFSNGMSDLGAPYGPVAYAKDANFVYLRGLATGASASAGFTLPAGFRPPAQRLWYFVGAAAAGGIEITTGGDVTGFGSIPSVVSFDGASFAL